MKILGIDPGSHITGYAFIEKKERNILIHEYGAIKAKPKDEVYKRLGIIHQELFDLCKMYQPDIMVMESSFYSKNVKTAMVLGHARGAIMTLCQQYNMNFFEYSPKEIKQMATGNGQAGKDLVAIMMQRLLGLRDLPEPEDASDALAVAYCHLQQLSTP